MAIYSHERQRLSICSFGARRKQRSKRLRKVFLFFGIVQKDSLQSGRERLRNYQTASQATVLYFMM